MLRGRLRRPRLGAEPAAVSNYLRSGSVQHSARGRWPAPGEWGARLCHGGPRVARGSCLDPQGCDLHDRSVARHRGRQRRSCRAGRMAGDGEVARYGDSLRRYPSADSCGCADLRPRKPAHRRALRSSRVDGEGGREADGWFLSAAPGLTRFVNRAEEPHDSRRPLARARAKRWCQRSSDTASVPLRSVRPSCGVRHGAAERNQPPGSRVNRAFARVTHCFGTLSSVGRLVASPSSAAGSWLSFSASSAQSSSSPDSLSCGGLPSKTRYSRRCR